MAKTTGKVRFAPKLAPTRSRLCSEPGSPRPARLGKGEAAVLIAELEGSKCHPAISARQPAGLEEVQLVKLQKSDRSPLISPLLCPRTA
jgi:hypothetical protein